MFRRLLQPYLKLLNKRPYTTQAVSSGLLCGAGDVICQLAIDKKPLSEYDFARTVPFVIVGGIYIAPLLIKWFRFLETIKFGGPRFSPITRVVVDQTIMGPIVQSTFQLSIRTLRGEKIDHSTKQIKKDFWSIYVNGLKIWPATQLVNFYLVPLQYRVLLVQAVALFWNVYMAWMTTRHTV